jgi:hypothetical protein
MSSTSSTLSQAPSALWDFNADNPIISFEDDKLGREPFARHLSAVLLKTVAIKHHLQKAPDEIITAMEQGTLRIPESYTVAVFGAWGSGKTSLKNLICAGMDEPGNNRPHVAHFEPRRWRDEDSIIRDFFQIIAKQVGEDDNPNAKATANLLLRLGDYLTVAQIALLLGGMAAGIGSYHWSDPSLATAGATGIASGNSLFGSVGEFLKNRGKKKTEQLDIVKGIIELEAELKEKMIQLEKPVVVFIDDIDRLSVDEVTLLLQLLKYNANFPNIIYVILGQRDIIDDGLEKLFPKHGGEYLEKFVQLALDLPQVETDDIREEVLSTIDSVAKYLDYNPVWVRREFSAIYEKGVAAYLPSLRQAHRYSNSLRFLVPLWKESGGRRAVHPVDASVLEIIRLYEPAVYGRLRKNKIWLTGSFIDIDKLVASLSSGSKENDQQKSNPIKPNEAQKLEEFLSLAKNKEALKVLLAALVPDIETLYSYIDDEGRPLTTNARARQYNTSLSFLGSRAPQHERFNHFRSFDRYFLLRVERNRLKDSDKIRLLSQLGKREELLACLREFKADGRLDDAMTELQQAVSEIKPGDVEEFVTAMMDWGDELPQDAWMPNSLLGSTSELGQLIRTALKQKGSVAEAIKCFETAARNSRGIHQAIIPPLMSMAAEFPEILQLSQEERGALEKRIRGLSAIGWERLKEVVSAPPEVIASGVTASGVIASGVTASGVTPLEERASFGPVLWMWAQQDRRACQEWTKELVLRPKGLAAFAREMADSRQDDPLDAEGYPAPNQMFSLLKMEDILPMKPASVTPNEGDSNESNAGSSEPETEDIADKAKASEGTAVEREAEKGELDFDASAPTPILSSDPRSQGDVISVVELESAIQRVSTDGLGLRDFLWVKTFQSAVANYMRGEKIPYFLMGQCPDPAIVEQAIAQSETSPGDSGVEKSEAES